MYQVIIIFHILVGLGIIGLVLMQQGRGADAGAAFGSGASGTVFGAQGSASFLSHTTAVFALLFFSTSLGLAVLGGIKDEPKDFMDAPEVEQSIKDMPQIENDASSPLNVPSINDQQAEEIPSIVSEDAASGPKAAEQQQK